MYTSLTKKSTRKGGEDKNLKRGIVLYSASGEWKNLPFTGSVLPNARINSIGYHKVDKSIWIALQETGLFRYDLSSHKLEDFSKSFFFDMKPPKISTISIDQKNNLHLIMDHGIMKVERLPK